MNEGTYFGELSLQVGQLSGQGAVFAECCVESRLVLVVLRFQLLNSSQSQYQISIFLLIAGKQIQSVNILIIDDLKTNLGMAVSGLNINHGALALNLIHLLQMNVSFNINLSQNVLCSVCLMPFLL